MNSQPPAGVPDPAASIPVPRGDGPTTPVPVSPDHSTAQNQQRSAAEQIATEIASAM
ncbi:hypothetical protein ABIB25_005524 [Nakamurella sp. UYEF19]|uniref:hypothetical protein n=1 Tax=Nakamurella sp. UYEF19 TaxID=1756392 RepID=UPI0033908938